MKQEPGSADELHVESNPPGKLKVGPQRIRLDLYGQAGFVGHVYARIPCSRVRKDQRLAVNVYHHKLDVEISPPPFTNVTTDGKFYYVYTSFVFQSHYIWSASFETIG